MFKPAPRNKEVLKEDTLPPNITLNVQMPEYPATHKSEVVLVWVYRAIVTAMLGYLVIRPVLDRVLH